MPINPTMMVRWCMGACSENILPLFHYWPQPEDLLGYKGNDSESVLFRHQAGPAAQYVTNALIGD
jgi:hypothetical protein